MLTPRLRFTIQERRDSFDRHNSHDRRNSNDPDGDSPMKKLDVEMLEVQQKQRRSSMQMRRTSLAEVIPDWPLLQKAKVAEKVHVRGRRSERWLRRFSSCLSLDCIFPLLALCCEACAKTGELRLMLAWLRETDIRLGACGKASEHVRRTMRSMRAMILSFRAIWYL